MTMDVNIAAHYQSLTPRYPELQGQVAVVTGGAKGIGQGIAARLAREGMQVVINDIDEAALTATATALRSLGATILTVPGDISQPQAITQLFTRTLDAFAGVHLLVNNAAELKRMRFLDSHEALLELELATNVRGPYLCSYHAAKIMSRAGGGNIIHLSSVGAVRAHWRGFPYDVTKGAIDALTRAMAVDLAEHHIRVNAIAPGATQTQRTPSLDTPRIQEIAARIPLQRFGLVSELSSVVAFLASPEASYITGQVIYVDGGITAQLSPPGQNL